MCSTIKTQQQQQKPSFKNIHSFSMSSDSELYLSNGLTNKKELFQPINKGKEINWYHYNTQIFDEFDIGQIRSYISIDIIQRILEEYFDYNVHYYMDIIDIHDNMIKQVEDKHLIEKYINDRSITIEKIFGDCQQAIEYMKDIRLTEQDENRQVIYDEKIIKTKNFIKNISTSDDVQIIKNKLFDDCYDIFCSYLKFDYYKTKILSSKKFTFFDQILNDIQHFDIERPTITNLTNKPADIITGNVNGKFVLHPNNKTTKFDGDYNKALWLEHFGHSFFLTIGDCHICDSSKNLIQFQQILEKYSSRQIRFLFLLNSWSSSLNYNHNQMEKVSSYEQMLIQFFVTATKKLSLTKNINYLNNHDIKANENEDDIILTKFFLTKTSEIHAALCNSIDTGLVLERIRELISSTNMYMNKENQSVNFHLLKDISLYITFLINTLGLNSYGPENDIGFTQFGWIENFESIINIESDRITSCEESIPPPNQVIFQSDPIDVQFENVIGDPK